MRFLRTVSRNEAGTVPSRGKGIFGPRFRPRTSKSIVNCGLGGGRPRPPRGSARTRKGAPSGAENGRPPTSPGRGRTRPGRGRPLPRPRGPVHPRTGPGREASSLDPLALERRGPPPEARFPTSIAGAGRLKGPGSRVLSGETGSIDEERRSLRRRQGSGGV